MGLIDDWRVYAIVYILIGWAIADLGRKSLTDCLAVGYVLVILLWFPILVYHQLFVSEK